VGFDTADDAGVYKLSPEIAMINTVDFITPPVDDPHWFGLIAAANSISDIYSMGGKPVTALNIVMFPSKQLPLEILKEILRGAHEKVIEAGACLVGGHTIEDEEPKFGLSVSGTVHPDRVITNAGSQVGDVLILTKPLGSGVLFNAARAGKLPLSLLEEDLLPSLAALNGAAMEEALQFDLHACTDITGFGIIGHILEVAAGSRTRIRLPYSSLPFYAEAEAMYKKGVSTLSNEANRRLSHNQLQLKLSLSTQAEELLFDPQTSGGLLFSLPASQGQELLDKLHQRGITSATIIGEVIPGEIGIEVV